MIGDLLQYMRTLFDWLTFNGELLYKQTKIELVADNPSVSSASHSIPSHRIFIRSILIHCILIVFSSFVLPATVFEENFPRSHLVPSSLQRKKFSAVVNVLISTCRHSCTACKSLVPSRLVLIMTERQ